MVLCMLRMVTIFLALSDYHCALCEVCTEIQQLQNKKNFLQLKYTYIYIYICVLVLAYSSA